MKETCGAGRYLGGWMYRLCASQFTDSGGYGFRLDLYKTRGHGRCMILAPIKTITCNSIQHPTTRDLSTCTLSVAEFVQIARRDATRRVYHLIAVKPFLSFGNFRPQASRAATNSLCLPGHCRPLSCAQWTL